MRSNAKCNCHICKVERSLFTSLNETQVIERFSRLAASSPPLAGFARPSALIERLHDRSNNPAHSPSASELLGALIYAGPSVGDNELSQSVLVLAFTPTIHRTYWEVRAWFRELEPEDIAQQTFAFFLQLTASVPLDMLNNHIAFVLSQALHRNAVRWARREQAKLLERERFVEEHGEFVEPSEAPQFEAVSLLKDFLAYCVRKGIISEFERDLLLRVKVDGFLAKEVLDRHTVLSPKAVHVRVQRIFKRLQDAARGCPSSNGNPAKPVESVEPMQTKNLSKSMSTFSLSTFPGGAAISVSRRQLSLDIPPGQATTKAQQSSTRKQDSLIRFANLTLANERQCVIREVASRRLAALQPSGFALALHRSTQSGESLPSNPDAGPARIIRKEFADNEEIPPKKICLSLAAARIRHILLLADSRISGVRSSGRWLAVGERRQRFDASVHNHNRSWPFSRLYCGRRFDVRFW
jgi:hypothetical protein